jgi:ATP-dependent DNA helicase DinG
MGNTPDYRSILLRQWEFTCTDSPKQRPSCQIADGDFVFTVKGNRDAWVEITKACGVPSGAVQTIDDAAGTLTYRWPCHADRIFGANGKLAQIVPNYEARTPQLHMARLVQRAIEMKASALMEAGTGTGKSFAYLAIAMAMGKRVVVSTSNKALQMQLAKKDAPFLIENLFPGKKLAVVVGKGNFACRLKVEGAERQAMKPMEADLRDWYLTTKTGNTEEIGFPVTWNQLAEINVDEDCEGKGCPLVGDCFYYQSKEERKGADVVICNHKILSMHSLYPAAEMLPGYDVLVVDEAHKLADVCRDTLGFEFTQPAIDKAIALATNLAEEDTLEDAKQASLAFATELGRFLADKNDFQVGLNSGVEFDTGRRLADKLKKLGEEVWPSAELPSSSDERKKAKRAQRIMGMGDNVQAMAMQNGMVRWLEPSKRDEPLTLCAKPADVSAFIASFTGLEVTPGAGMERPDHTKCHRCRRTLTAKNVAILNGHPYGPECIRKVDPFGDAEIVPLEGWLNGSYAVPVLAEDDEPIDPRVTTQPVIFTSATMAIPDSNGVPVMTGFLRECGLPDAYQLVVASPFDYKTNALTYVPQGAAPAPNERGWMEWATGEMRQLVLASHGGAFLLFTSYKALNEALHELRYTFVSRGLTVLVQGDMPKLELAKRFKEDGNAVLFATESFFEGVDIQGDALRLVIIDKIPFAAPSPLGQAQEAAIEAMGGNGFNDFRLPNAIIKLKQATGRLIRTRKDKGVIVILDSRLRSSRYGRSRVLPSLPDAPLVGRIAAVDAFYEEYRPKVNPVWGAVPATSQAPAAPSLATVLDGDLPF